MRWTSRVERVFNSSQKDIQQGSSRVRGSQLYTQVPFDTALTTSPKRPCRPCKGGRIVMFNHCRHCMPLYAIVCHCPISSCLHASHDPYNIARQDDPTILKERQTLSKAALCKVLCLALFNFVLTRVFALKTWKSKTRARRTLLDQRRTCFLSHVPHASSPSERFSEWPKRISWRPGTSRKVWRVCWIWWNM